MKKLFLSLILIFFVSLSTVRVYGYIEDSGESYISEDSTRVKIVEKMRSNTGKNLVPTGVILGVKDTEEIIYTYKVFVQEGLDFNYAVQNVLINQEILSEDIRNLFNFDFEVEKLENENIQVKLFDSGLEGNYYEISVKLTMNLPTIEQYELIAGYQLSFEFIVENEL